MKQLFVILYPALEIFLLVKVGQAIGGLATVALIFGSAGLGFWLLRVRCKEGIQQITHQLSEGAIPKQEILDNLLIFFAGIFFIIPGIFTNILGILLLFPFVRNFVLAKAGSALYRYSRTPGSTLYSATSFFVYDSNSGEFHKATPSQQADAAFSTDFHDANESDNNSSNDMIIDCKPIDERSKKTNATEDPTELDCTFRQL